MSEVKICPTCGSEYPVSERFCPRDGSALRGQNADGDLTGTVIAERYHVMKKLGEGGMGTVYLAEHVKMGRKSALKVMNPGMSQDPDAIARFNREASNASRLNHPNICAIYDFGETPEGLIYLAMEFIEGESLTSIIERDGALPPARAASILHQAADGLQVAHDYGIVHRDLKPDNIMIAKARDNADVVKVVDFGIAKAHTSDAQKVTKTGLVVGTPEYMSPEQLAGDKLDGRSDIYSLALVGFNMLTGTLPFPSKSAQEAMIMRLTDNPRKLAEMRPEVAWPDALQSVMDKALARDAKDRYQKASDFGREFAMAIEAMPATTLAEAGTVVIGAQGASPAAGTAAIPRTRVSSEAEKGAAKPGPAPTPVAKRGSGMMIGVGVVVVIALIAGGTKVAGLWGGAKAATDTSTLATQMPADTADRKATGGNPPTGDSKQSGTTKQPEAGRGNSKAAGQPPAQGNQAAGGTGGAAPPVQPQGPTRKELDDLESMVNGINTDSPDQTTLARALARANELLLHANGVAKGELLIRRGMVFTMMDQKDDACKDLREARLLTSRTDFQQLITIFMSTAECK